RYLRIGSTSFYHFEQTPLYHLHANQREEYNVCPCTNAASTTATNNLGSCTCINAATGSSAGFGTGRCVAYTTSTTGYACSNNYGAYC
ncbi:unnamed protein product, partial [Rotaria sp. Silwood2]